MMLIVEVRVMPHLNFFVPSNVVIYYFFNCMIGCDVNVKLHSFWCSSYVDRGFWF